MDNMNKEYGQPGSSVRISPSNIYVTQHGIDAMQVHPGRIVHSSTTRAISVPSRTWTFVFFVLWVVGVLVIIMTRSRQISRVINSPDPQPA